MREDNHIIGSLVDFCAKRGVKCVVQVGAEDGAEVDAVREKTGCRAVAIDADHRCAPCSAKLEYYHAAIGATDCMTEFYLHANLGLSTHFPRQDSKEEYTLLKQFRLDTFCLPRNIHPDALLIDTEGTTLEVLEGSGELLKGVKIIYAECQAYPIRAGMRTNNDVDKFLAPLGFTQHRGLPSYWAGEAQGNYTWVKE